MQWRSQSFDPGGTWQVHEAPYILLCISYKKCNLMYIGNTRYRPSLMLNDVTPAVVDEVRDLGVIIDSCLTFDAHIHQTVVRAFVRANLIYKCFASRDIFTLISATIRCILDLL